jgi:segregation and condensation protein A
VSSSPINFQLDQYEGPLDLLLDLIRKQEINIYDIPIARITSQYMEYLNKAAALDIELGAEFVYMAATLIHIKSKTLLPKDPELEKISPEEDPRKELVDRLLEHEKYKNAAEMLQQKRIVEEAAWSNPQMEQFLNADEGPGLAATLFDLVKTFQTVLDRAKNRPTYDIGKEDVTVPDMIRYLRASLERLPRSESISATCLFEEQGSRRAMLCLFLAILELVKRQAILLQQTDAFGDIAIKRTSTFAEAFAVEQTISEAEAEYK